VLDALTYPAPRERPDRLPLRDPKGYTRYETLERVLADTDTRVELGRFSGVPDAIDASSNNGATLLTLADDLGREESTFTVDGSDIVHTEISRRVVFAVRRDALETPRIIVVGKWFA
jgi:hypothetical protein